jgi:serine/threonine-protein kinase
LGVASSRTVHGNHPNIAQIYGLEKSVGVTAIIMELVDGSTLADRIANGPIPLDEALPMAKQIAEALEAAHEKGILHRDLKPANIAVTGTDQVKVLDFGLAKLAETTPSESSAALATSPTLTSPAMMTRVGVLLGTAPYMSPAQAKGRPADRRSDTWAWGCVLFEMLTGRRAFEGEDVSDTLASVLRAEPDWTALPGTTPIAVTRLLRRCLRKQSDRRMHDIADVRLDLEDALSSSPDHSPTPPTRRVQLGRTGIAVLTGVIVVTSVTGVLIWTVMRGESTVPVPTVRFTLSVPLTAPYVGALGGELAISPDGTRVVYPAFQQDKRLLYLRTLDELEPPRPLPGTDDAYNPFFSPDGEWVAYFTRRAGGLKLKKVAVRGGAPIPLADALAPLGGTWRPDDTILFATEPNGPGKVDTVIFQVSAAGGSRTPLTALNSAAQERAHAWPDVLPDGTVLFTVRTGRTFVEAYIAALTPSTGKYRKVIEHGYHARYVSTGHVVYMVGSTLWAVPFDAKTLVTTGTAVPVISGIESSSAPGEVSYAVSPTGLLVYVPGSVTNTEGARRTLSWIDRQGRNEPVGAPPRAYSYPRVSPDQTRLALDVREQQNDIWIWHLVKRTFERVTFDPEPDVAPLWTPEGTRIIFGATVGTTQNLAWKAASGTSDVEHLVPENPNQQAPTDISREGRFLIFNEIGPGLGSDLMMLSLPDRQMTALLHTPSDEVNGVLSPDGRWLAYESDDSGEKQIYVSPFPTVSNGRIPVSTRGGSRPAWSRRGTELF